MQVLQDMRRIVSVPGRPESTGISRPGGAGVAASSLALLWVLVSLLVHPLRHDISDRAGAALLPGSEIAPSVMNVFNHACINCHSEKTHWPWYSQVAPASWFIEGDVKRARQHLNLSRWDSLDAEQRLLLTAIATVIENREMPPRRYVILHPEAKLSADDSVQVIEWTRGERRRLRASMPKLTLK